MKLSIKNKEESKFSPEYEILIDGKPIESDQLTNISINMPADDIPKVVLTYDIDELDVEDLNAENIRRTSDIPAGRIVTGTISANVILGS